MRVSIDCIARSVRAPVSVSSLRTFARRTTQLVPHRYTALHLSVAFIGPKESRKLNRQFRRRRHPADVLSFLLSDRGSKRLEGEILLCPQAIRQRIRRSGRTLSRETVLLFVHGLLHLFGMDHETERDARVMERAEERVCGEAVTS